jgi:poly(ribitol-phosphate) beta-N-acetylglucosaminyltransferase
VGEPDVTVVVPVYNTMPYLTATLDSLVRQTIGPGRLEVVTVDDGSTDGSGEELDRYAEQHPGLFTVVHQANSGGPAVPCNVGLERARGRYVFFLGADDYLGDEALERLVDRADAWESDVVCARIVGEGGRWVNQVLYAEDVVDMPFPSAALASALSNTKLFRRSLLDEHDITFAHDLKVGSDQPFTIEAMLRARRVSVVGDYDYYHAVKRDDGSNITYSSDWQSRLAGISAVVGHIADVIGPGDGRDLLLGRHFSGEISTLLRRDFYELDESDRVELLRRVNDLAAAYLTEPMLPRLRVLDRWRFLLARDLRLAELAALEGLDEAAAPLQVDGDGVVLRYPGLPASEAGPGDRIGRHLAAAVGPAELLLQGDRIEVAVPIALVAPSNPVARIALADARDGSSAPARSYPRDPGAGALSAPAVLAGDTLRTTLDVDQLSGRRGVGSLLALRVQFDIGERTYGVPVPFGRFRSADGSADSVVARADGSSMTLVELGQAGRPMLDKIRARWGRKK